MQIVVQGTVTDSLTRKTAIFSIRKREQFFRNMSSCQLRAQFTTQHRSIGAGDSHIKPFIQLAPNIHLPTINNLYFVKKKSDTPFMFLNNFIHYTEITEFKSIQ